MPIVCRIEFACSFFCKQTTKWINRHISTPTNLRTRIPTYQHLGRKVKSSKITALWRLVAFSGYKDLCSLRDRSENLLFLTHTLTNIIDHDVIAALDWDRYLVYGETYCTGSHHVWLYTRAQLCNHLLTSFHKWR